MALSGTNRATASAGQVSRYSPSKPAAGIDQADRRIDRFDLRPFGRTDAPDGEDIDHAPVCFLVVRRQGYAPPRAVAMVLAWGMRRQRAGARTPGIDATSSCV
ncbi:MAG: hypothetical protein WDO24_07600 [Pseudomonadota bacterium]